MSYFPADIPFMSEEELKENGIRIPKIEAANEVVKLAEDVLHIELLPWQKYFIAAALAIGVTKELPPAEPQIIRCRDCVNYKDHRCTEANHHVSEKESCAEVFGVKRRTE